MTKELKPFDLHAALKGEPVMLRNGSKAFVRHHETEITIHDNFTLIGVTEEHPFYLSWFTEGRVYADYENEHDIIGMYLKTHMINGFEVPAPETEAPVVGSKYFLAACLYRKFFDKNIWHGGGIDKRWLERGLVFLNKEDAIANAKAMLSINPYDGDEAILAHKVNELIAKGAVNG